MEDIQAAETRSKKLRNNILQELPREEEEENMNPEEEDFSGLETRTKRQQRLEIWNLNRQISKNQKVSKLSSQVSQR